MKLEITTPDTTLFSGEVQLVQLPGIDGSFEVLNNHASIISALKQGKVKIKTEEGTTEYIEINGGIIEVLKNKILILAE